MINLSKKVTINAFVKPFSNSTHNISTALIREEFYEILIMQELFASIHLVPEHLYAYIYGHLFMQGLILTKSDIVSMRLCEANKFYIQLKEDIALQIHNAGSVIKYIESFPKMGWGDIIPLEPQVIYVRKDFLTCLDKISGELFDLSQNCFFAVQIINGAIKVLSYDVNANNTIDKLCGLVEIGTSFEGILLSNCQPTMDIVRRMYKMRVNTCVFSGAPTNNAMILAKKANITLISKDRSGSYTIYADTCSRIADGTTHFCI